MPTENYTPFGPEWHKEMKKHDKDFLIEMLKSELQKAEELKTKAAKWDALDEKLSPLFGHEDEETGEWIENEESGLDTIGEVAATAFGYM